MLHLLVFSPSASLKTGSFCGTVLVSQTTPVFFRRVCELLLLKPQWLDTCSARAFISPIWCLNLRIIALRLLIIIEDFFCSVKWHLETCKRWFILILFQYFFQFIYSFNILQARAKSCGVHWEAAERMSLCQRSWINRTRSCLCKRAPEWNKR